jgi:hypothetical protein
LDLFELPFAKPSPACGYAANSIGKMQMTFYPTRHHAFRSNVAQLYQRVQPIFARLNALAYQFKRLFPADFAPIQHQVTQKGIVINGNQRSTFR